MKRTKAKNIPVGERVHRDWKKSSARLGLKISHRTERLIEKELAREMAEVGGAE
jgi:hypothetical protein